MERSMYNIADERIVSITEKRKDEKRKTRARQIERVTSVEKNAIVAELGNACFLHVASTEVPAHWPVFAKFHKRFSQIG